MVSFKEGDKVRFKTNYGWGGTDPYFHGTVVKRGNQLKIEGEDFEDSIEIKADWIKNLQKEQ